jgi:ubiquinone/menaquinone biosynthesis C-methylase UbiE
MLGSIKVSPAKPVKSYESVAQIYDVIMQHVDYDEWGEYVTKLIQMYLGKPVQDLTILEVATGTGNFAFELERRLGLKLRSIDAFDNSPEMIREAQRKAAERKSDVQFFVADMKTVETHKHYDAALMMYDSINYMMSEADVVQAFRQTATHLVKGGLFIFDASMEANSINNIEYLSDAVTEHTFAYKRRATYDRVAKIHTTAFEIIFKTERFAETHQQKIYSFKTFQTLIAAAGFNLVDSYADIAFRKATDRSERITFICRK